MDLDFEGAVRLITEIAGDEHEISLKPNPIKGKPPIVSCTCLWAESATSLWGLGMKAKNHSMETGHKLRGATK